MPYQFRGYAPAAATPRSDWRIRALPVLLYSSATTSGAQPRAGTRSPEGLVSRCQEPPDGSITPL